MSILDDIGRTVLLQHEGNRQIAAALANGIQHFLRRVSRLFGSTAPDLRAERQRP